MAPAAGAQTRAAIASGTFDNEYGVTPMIISLYVRVFRRDPLIEAAPKSTGQGVPLG